MILSSPSQFCYDELYHLQLAQNVRDYGWRLALISPDNHSAVGPLYPAGHLAFSAVTGMQAPAIRWVNLVCLGVVILLIGPQVAEKSLNAGWIKATSLLAVPFLWPASGMALTELPALVPFTLFFWLFNQVLRSTGGVSARSIALGSVAGLTLGIAILGRQTYFVVVPSVVAMVIWAPRKWLELLVCVVVALLSCGWLFILWNGLVPPSLQYVVSGFHLDYGVLSLSYVAGATLFLNPKWMKPRNAYIVIGSVAIGVIFAWFTRDYANPPAKSLLLRLFGERIGFLTGFIIGTGFCIIGVMWLWNSFEDAWRQRHYPARVFAFLTLFPLLISPMMVSHLFSSRYVVGLLGVLLIVVHVPDEGRSWWVSRMLSGSLVGAATLWTYFR